MTATTNPKPAHSRAHAAEVAMIVRRGLVTVLLAAGLMVMSGVARASALTTVCASGCNFTSIQTAVNNSNPDDFIEVMPGTYPGQAVVTVPLHIFAPPSGPRPVITTSQSGSAVQIQPAAAGSTISHLDIRSTSMDNAALRADGAVKATDLVLTCHGRVCLPGWVRAFAAGPGRHRDQLVERLSVHYRRHRRRARRGDRRDGERLQYERCRPRRRREPDRLNGQRQRGGSRDWRDRAADDAERRRRWPQGGRWARDEGLRQRCHIEPGRRDRRPGMARCGLELRNVTAVASGSGSTGLGALSAAGPGGTGGQIDARNVIARGTANGASGEPGTPSGCAGPCAPGTVKSRLLKRQRPRWRHRHDHRGPQPERRPAARQPGGWRGAGLPYRQPQLAADRRRHRRRKRRPERSRRRAAPGPAGDRRL